MRHILPSTLVVLAAATLACSSSNTPTPELADTGSSNHGVVTDTGASDSATDAPPAEAGPQLCWLTHPNDSSFQLCDACSQSKCNAQWVAAYGAGYMTDDFSGGACVDDVKCECGCGQDDATCIEACDISQTDACGAAKRALYQCENTNCADPCGRN